MGHEVELCVGIGLVVGAIFYLAALSSTSLKFDPWQLGEAIAAGGDMAVSGHMAFAAYFPKHLVHLADAEGKPIHDDSIQVMLGQIHFLEIEAAAVLAFCVGVVMLWNSVSKKAGH